MKISDKQFEKLLSSQTAQAAKGLIAQRKLVPSLPQATKLRLHIESIQGNRRKIRLGVVHTYTSELLDPWLKLAATLNQLDLDIYHSPYGMTLQEATENSGLVRHSPDITLLLLTREDLHPMLQTPIACINSKDRSDLHDQIQQSVSGMIKKFRESIPGHIILTLLPNSVSTGLGLYDDVAENSEAHWWNLLKATLAKDIRQNFSAVSYLDFDQLTNQVGQNHFFDSRLWYTSAFPFTPDGAFSVSSAVTTIAASIFLPKAKVIVLDADNTMWGGIIGEDGINGIALGKDYPGKAYVDFQKRILNLQQRGFILALCSKNNPEDVDEVLQNHPHQLLKNKNFTTQRVNWQSKPDNLRSIAKELNVGLDSFIFVDDSDYECASVRHSLPEVEVVQVPSKPAEVPTCLDALSRLEITSLTAEDINKTAMYAQEKERKLQLDALKRNDGSVEDYLASLNMSMRVGLDDTALVARLAQLTQKTNQFNLTTQRYTESDISEKISSDSFSVYHFSLADNFGDSGVVGVAIVERDTNKRANLDTFLMSCRVIGRKAEVAFLNTIVLDLKASGFEELQAAYTPTRKNVLVENFLPDNGFTLTTDGSYISDLLMKEYKMADDFPIKIEGFFNQ